MFSFSSALIFHEAAAILSVSVSYEAVGTGSSIYSNSFGANTYVVLIISSFACIDIFQISVMIFLRLKFVGGY